MAIFYADSAGASGSGTGVDPDNPATLKECITDDVVLHTALVAGSLIHCKNGTVITFDSAPYAATAVAGTTIAPMRVISYASTVGDGGVTEIKNTTARTQSAFSQTKDFWHYANFKFNQCLRGIISSADPGRDGHMFKNIYGLDCQNVIQMSAGVGLMNTYVNCYSKGATGVGFKDTGRARRFINCVAIDGLSAGFEAGGGYGCFMSGCLAHNNSGDGFDTDDASLLVNCLSDGNGSDGYFFGTAQHPSVMINCGASNNGAYGVEGVADTTVYAIHCALQPTGELNTTDKVNAANVTLFEFDEVTGDPLFTSVAGDDFSLGDGSAWKAAALRLGADAFTATENFMDLGPAQREEPAGGGGGGVIKQVGVGGGMVG